MKKVSLIICVLLIFLLSSCQEKMEPYQEVSISEFTIVHADENFTLWKRKSEFDYLGLSQSYPGYSYEFESETCTADFGPYNFMLEYSGDFFSIGEGFKIDLYGPHDLEEYGILFTCRDM